MLYAGLILGLLFGGAVVAVGITPALRGHATLERALAGVVVAFLALVLGMQVSSLLGMMRPEWGAVIVIPFALLAWRMSGRLQADTPSIDDRSIGWLSKFSAGGAVILGAWGGFYYLLRGWTMPVEAVSDAPIYHLPFAIQWAKAGRIFPVATPFGELSATYFPANGSLWFAALVMLTGDESLAKVGQWPFLPIAAAALFAICRRIGGNNGSALVATGPWCLLPATLLLAGTANVDLIFTTFYLIACYFLVPIVEGEIDRPRLADVFLFATSCGLALGTKSIGLVFVPWLVLVAVAGVIVRRRSARRALLEVAWMGLWILLPAGYWYIRNALLTGNPLYPLQIEAFGKVLFHGWCDGDAMRQSSYHIPPAQWWLLLHRLSIALDARVGLLWGATILLTLLRPVVAHTREDWWSAGYAGLALLHVALYWLVIPYNSQERFLLPAFALGLAPLARLLRDWSVLQAGLAFWLGWHLLTPAWYFDPFSFRLVGGSVLLPVTRDPLTGGSLPLGLVLPVVLTLALVVLVSHCRGRFVIAAASVLLGCWLASMPLRGGLAEAPLASFYPVTGFGRSMFDAWQTLERHSTEGARVAYCGTNLPYYLFATGLRNEVRYVNVAGPLDWLPHDFHLERVARGEESLYFSPWPDWHREKANFETWRSNLRAARIELILVARENLHGVRDAPPGPAPFPIEHTWMEERPQQFERLGPARPSDSAESWAYVYRVR